MYIIYPLIHPFFDTLSETNLLRYVVTFVTFLMLNA